MKTREKIETAILRGQRAWLDEIEQDGGIERWAGEVLDGWLRDELWKLMGLDRHWDRWEVRGSDGATIKVGLQQLAIAHAEKFIEVTEFTPTGTELRGLKKTLHEAYISKLTDLVYTRAQAKAERDFEVLATKFGLDVEEETADE